MRRIENLDKKGFLYMFIEVPALPRSEF